MKPAAFEYSAPRSLEEATAQLAELGDAAKVLAGGQSLLPMLALRLAFPEHLVDVGRLPELQGVTRTDGHVRIGAATTETAVGRDPEVVVGVPLLARVTPLVGHLQIRNRGTLGGSLAHADPAGEYPAVALALDAQLEVASVRGRRTLPASDFFEGIWTTTLEPDEVVSAATFPVWEGRCGFAVQEFARRHGDYALAGAVVGVQLDDSDRVTRCSIGLIGLGSTPLRARSAEAQALGAAVSDVDGPGIGRLAVAGLDAVPADLHGSAAYRVRLGAAMVARAWSTAVAEAKGTGVG